MESSYRADRVTIGVCYYPEHWPETLWADDFDRMRELGMSHVRMAEFGWTLMEPVEGEFDFSLFDKAVSMAHERGLKVILGTPSACPPAWLTEKYPEVLNASREGVVYRHGMRRHYNYNSPKYRELCARIVRKMAEHYGGNPAVAGWQIDNEFNCEMWDFYSDADHTAFREWAKRRYGSLDALNQAWGAVFWSQTYTDWNQIYLTRPTVSNSPNPHHLLDERRFISDSVISFASMQAEIIRQNASGQWITTNGLFGHLNSHELTAKALDFISYDSYPMFGLMHAGSDTNALADRGVSMSLTTVRSISRNFVIMEQQSGPGGWVNRMHQMSPKPGQVRLWTYQSIGHGADLIVYFRWRTAAFGTEIYWHGINDHHNRPNRRIREVAQISEELAKVGSTIAGTKNVKQALILKSYDNDWDSEFDGWCGSSNSASNDAWLKALQRRHIQLDVAFVESGLTAADLAGYTAVIVPQMSILTEKTADMLRAYVESGGVVVFGNRTGYKNEHGHCLMQPAPGPISDLCSVEVEDYSMVHGDPPTLAGPAIASGSTLTADRFNEILSPTSDTVEVLARYTGDYYDGKPVLTRNRVGSGFAYYYGAAFNQSTAEAVIDVIGLRSAADGWLDIPASVELTVREDAATGRRMHFLLNYLAESAKIGVSGAAADLLGGSHEAGILTLPAYGAAIVERV
jgi:beta-galactosidase